MDNIGDRDIYEDYPGAWYSPVKGLLIQIGRILLNQDIKGKGDIHVKNHKRHDDEYLLACSQDGENWDYYFFYPNKQSIVKTSKQYFDKNGELKEIDVPY